MLSMKKDEFPDGLFLVRALIAWLLCAAVLLVLAALTANAAKMGEPGIACLSSGVSFLCAAAAGKAAAESKKSNSLGIAAITATALVIFLLTAGFLIRGEDMAPSSVLSLVSFGYAGVLFGSLILYKPDRPRSKKTVKPRN
jgi:hypothetical protein